MATGKEWREEINKMSKDELTMVASAYDRLLKWNFFAREFQLKSFAWRRLLIQDRIEELAKKEEKI